MNHIIMALDFSEFSPQVEKVGYTLAQKINASVTLVTIINQFIDSLEVTDSVKAELHKITPQTYTGIF